jgi:hypothetical protein
LREAGMNEAMQAKVLTTDEARGGSRSTLRGK